MQVPVRLYGLGVAILLGLSVSTFGTSHRLVTRLAVAIAVALSTLVVFEAARIVGARRRRRSPRG